jgi:hypothetical protein
MNTKTSLKIQNDIQGKQQSTEISCCDKRCLWIATP